MCVLFDLLMRFSFRLCVQRYFVPVSGPTTCYTPYYATAAATPYATVAPTAAAAPSGLYASSPIGATMAAGPATGLLGSDGGLQTQQMLLGDQQNGLHMDRSEVGTASWMSMLSRRGEWLFEMFSGC